MKKISFHFDDKLEYQQKAVDSVVNIFKGVKKIDGNSIIDKIYKSEKLTKEGDIKGQEIFDSYYNIYPNKRIFDYEFTRTMLLENINEIQRGNDLYMSNDIDKDNLNITVEMETGTGKTYVYIKTILELHRTYGFKKFIIVVPSIPIRLGVYSSIQMLNDHFYPNYNINIKEKSFIYDSKKIAEARQQFAEKDDLSIMIINYQAFNSNNNKMRIATEMGAVFFDDIQDIKPFMIIDEPQKVEGTTKKKSEAKKAIDKMKPQFILRYSATHKTIENLVYKLDSYSAAKQELVKNITVKTVFAELSKDTIYIKYKDFDKKTQNAKVEILAQKQGEKTKMKIVQVDSKSSIYELSGNLEQYKNIYLPNNPNRDKPLTININGTNVDIEKGNVYSNVSDSDSIRYQIRIAIRSHFEKQFEIFEKQGNKPIKALTLFFIDKVSKVRDLNNSDDDRGEYLRIFDEEYNKFILTNKFKENYEKYKTYLSETLDVNKVREGYFAIDKKGKAVLKEINAETIANADKNENRDNAIELILKDKDKLISFDTPLAFIFSHSALREGWDNPNIFTICTLKRGNSDIAKKQELGRGLRIPVDINGNRLANRINGNGEKISNFDAKINNLTVIANDSYENFASMLQKDYAENNNFNKNAVTEDVLYRTLKNTNIPEKDFTGELLDIFKNELKSQKIINEKDEIPKDTNLKGINFNNEILKEYEEDIINELEKVMKDKGSNHIEIINGDEIQRENEYNKFVKEGKFINIYERLLDRLKIKTTLKINLNNEEFISDCIKELDENMEMYKNRRNLKLTVSDVVNKKGGNVDLVKDDGRSQSSKTDMDKYITTRSNLELANAIMKHTELPRLAILEILLKLKKENREAINIQDVLDTVIEKIKELIKEHSGKYFLTSKIDEINSYSILESKKHLAKDIFSMDAINNEIYESRKNSKKLFEATHTTNKSMHKYYLVDSEGELEFANYLNNPDNDNIIMFTKLKKGGFIIETPYGSYSPDWAIVCGDENNNDFELFFIAESKFDKEWNELLTEEQVKINCAKVHFKTVSEHIDIKDLHFDWIKSSDEFESKFAILKK